MILYYLTLSLISTKILKQSYAFPQNKQWVDMNPTKLSGVVAAPDETCKKISENIINSQGGNTVDAAIAASLCSGVINSYASGIGGGAFMLIQPSKLGNLNVEKYDIVDEFGVPFSRDDPVFIDCRETAPKLSTFDMFVNKTNPLFGGLAVGVPGELHCFEQAHKLFGKLPWKVLFEDSIKLARDGFKIPFNLAGRIRYLKDEVLANPVLKTIFAPHGELLKTGDICRRPQFADTLEEIANKGIYAFYSGRIAESIVSTIQANKGIMTVEDLKNYRPIFRRPLKQSYKQFELLVPTAPSAGPSLLSMLNIAEHFDLGTSIDAQNAHVIVEAIKFGTAQKTILGDATNSYDIQKDIEKIISKETGEKNAKKLNLNKTFPPLYYAEDQFNNDVLEKGTCHISVLGSFSDQESFEAVSITTTINFPFGAWVIDPETGIFLNNQMGDFSMPGSTDRLGRPTNPRNFPKPGNRPLSSMVPTIIRSTDSDYLAIVGASGGPRIFPSVFQTIIAALNWKANATESVSAPRLYHPLTPNAIELELNYKLKHPDIISQFISKGHKLKVLGKDSPMASLVQIALRNEDGSLSSARDPRINLLGIGQ